MKMLCRIETKKGQLFSRIQNRALRFGLALSGLALFASVPSQSSESQSTQDASVLMEGPSIRSIGAKLAFHGGVAQVGEGASASGGGPGGVILGGRLGLVLNHFFSVGVGGEGVLSDARNLVLMGLHFELDPWSRVLVHPSIGVFFGGALVTPIDPATRTDRPSDGRFFTQPELRLTVNISRNLRLSAQGGYRVTAGSDRVGVSNSSLRGFQAALQVAGGLF